MTERELHRQRDETVGQFLSGHGFAARQPGDYLRSDTCGDDRVLVSRDRRTASRFLVGLSHYPKDIEALLDTLLDRSGEDRGFPCGPYLTPVGVRRREKYWSSTDSKRLASSLHQVVSCLATVGLPWLESLRDRRVFAQNVDPDAVIYAALAHEAAGDVTQAEDYYQEYMRRLRGALALGGRESDYLRQCGRAFVFVAKKLGVEAERCEDFQRKLDFFPDVRDVRPLRS